MMKSFKLIKNDPTQQFIQKLGKLSLDDNHPIVRIKEKISTNRVQVRINRDNQVDAVSCTAMVFGLVITLQLLLYIIDNAPIGITYLTHGLCIAIIVMNCDMLHHGYLHEKEKYGNDFDVLFRLKEYFIDCTVDEFEWYQFVEKSLDLLNSLSIFFNSGRISQSEFLTILENQNNLNTWLSLFEFRNSNHFPQMFKIAFSPAFNQIQQEKWEKEGYDWFTDKVKQYAPVLHTLMIDENETHLSLEELELKLNNAGEGKSRQELNGIINHLDSIILHKIKNPHYLLTGTLSLK